MAWSQSSKIHRYKFYLKTLFLIYKPRCYFCGKLLKWEEFYPKQSSRKNGHIIDPFLVHHKDGNKHNDNPKNWAFAERDCHGVYNWLIRNGRVKKGQKLPEKQFLKIKSRGWAE